jgi:hypothetical protein
MDIFQKVSRDEQMDAIQLRVWHRLVTHSSAYSVEGITTMSHKLLHLERMNSM